MVENEGQGGQVCQVPKGTYVWTPFGLLCAPFFAPTGRDDPDWITIYGFNIYHKEWFKEVKPNVRAAIFQWNRSELALQNKDVYKSRLAFLDDFEKSLAT